MEFIYGTLKPRGTGFGDGALLDLRPKLVRQRHAQGLDDVGYLYVPADRAKPVSTCRLHVFLHALNQSNFTRGDLLFPRAFGPRPVGRDQPHDHTVSETYPHERQTTRGCLGHVRSFTTRSSTRKAARKFEAIMAMVARITSGYRPSQAIEYRHAGFGHYFVTAEQDEIA